METCDDLLYSLDPLRYHNRIARSVVSVVAAEGLPPDAAEAEPVSEEPRPPVVEEAATAGEKPAAVAVARVGRIVAHRVVVILLEREDNFDQTGKDPVNPNSAIGEFTCFRTHNCRKSFNREFPPH